MNGKVKCASNRWQRAAAALCFLLSTPSCSLLFVTAPPKATEHQEGRRTARSDCTTSRAAPIVDTVIGGYQVFRTGYALSADESAYEQAPITREADIMLGVGLTALFLGSAIYGYAKTSQCEEWRREPVQWGDDNDWVE